ncbi:hypothetical protein ABEY69_25185 [Priestia filamentosa]|uniref:hypothetical protein n=1 Tax=Priestia filamentosa TaxID=1402861 RepID=UPI003D2AFEED
MNVPEGYVVTDDVYKASHWIAHVDERFSVEESRVIPGKVYAMIMDLREQEFWVLDEDGALSMAFLMFKGDFITMKEAIC